MSFYMIIIFFITYMICSINPAIEVCKRKTGEDIRKLGSGNAGTANAMRVLGRPFGMLVILLDIGKVYLSYYIISWVTKKFGYTTDMTTFNTIFILATIIGHCFPVYYKFRGGKGVVVGMTLITILEPKIVIICVISALIVMAITRTVAKGTIAGTILYFIISIVMGCDHIVAVTIATCIVMFKHRESISRILAKQEHKF